MSDAHPRVSRGRLNGSGEPKMLRDALPVEGWVVILAVILLLSLGVR